MINEKLMLALLLVNLLVPTLVFRAAGLAAWKGAVAGVGLTLGGLLGLLFTPSSGVATIAEIVGALIGFGVVGGALKATGPVLVRSALGVVLFGAVAGAVLG